MSIITLYRNIPWCNLSLGSRITSACSFNEATRTEVGWPFAKCPIAMRTKSLLLPFCVPLVVVLWQNICYPPSLIVIARTTNGAHTLPIVTAIKLYQLYIIARSIGWFWGLPFVLDEWLLNTRQTHTHVVRSTLMAWRQLPVVESQWFTVWEDLRKETGKVMVMRLHKPLHRELPSDVIVKMSNVNNFTQK